MLASICLALVRFYRRRLARRGPFACVRCTFEKLESCSAFAERSLQEAPARCALGRIVRRLARCRQLSLYRLSDGGLAYGEGYEAVAAAENSLSAAQALRRLNAVLASDGESAAVRAAVCRGALLATAQHRLLTSEGQGILETLPLIRDAAAVRRTLESRCRSRLAATLCALVLTCLFFALGIPALAATLGLFMIIGALSALSARRIVRRLDGFEVLAAIDGPFDSALTPCAALNPQSTRPGGRAPVPVESRAAIHAAI